MTKNAHTSKTFQLIESCRKKITYCMNCVRINLRTSAKCTLSIVNIYYNKYQCKYVKFNSNLNHIRNQIRVQFMYEFIYSLFIVIQMQTHSRRRRAARRRARPPARTAPSPAAPDLRPPPLLAHVTRHTSTQYIHLIDSNMFSTFISNICTKPIV